MMLCIPVFNPWAFMLLNILVVLNLIGINCGHKDEAVEFVLWEVYSVII